MGISPTKYKGDVGNSAILADLTRKGYLVLQPFGDNAPFDLVIFRDNKFEKIQCKYTESDGFTIEVKCRSTNGRIDHRYTAEEVDWIAVFDLNTNTCYYVHSSLFDGMTSLHLRLVPPKNNMQNLRYAKDFLLL